MLVAILRGEPGSEALHVRLLEEPALCMTAVNYWEVLARAARVAGPQGQRQASALIDSYAIAVVSADRTLSDSAADSFRIYGRPQPAGLNLGDCYAHALASQLDAPLMFIGADFGKTNVRPA